MKSFLQPEFQIVRDEDRCIHCEVCVRQCAFESHSYDSADGKVTTDSLRCVGCQRCATLCPTQALVVREHPREYRGNAYWTARTIEEIYKQAETGGLLLSSMGSDMPHTLYWDNLLLDASQVTNPSIDPLREPMELKTFLGRKPRAVKLSRHGRTAVLETALAPQLEIETPILFSAMSYGAISYNTCLALAGAARECGIFYNTGEGGLHRDLYRFGKNTIVRVNGRKVQTTFKGGFVTLTMSLRAGDRIEHQGIPVPGSLGYPARAATSSIASHSSPPSAAATTA